MKIGKKIIVLAVIVFVIFPIFAHAVSWLPLVPCGVSNDNPDTPQDERKPCNQCDLLRLLKNIIDFVLIGLMPPAAAILFVWGGFLILMGGANPGWITQGKSIFWNTAMGVAIISASWLISNSIIRSIGVETITQDGVVTNVAKEWWKFECRVTVPAEQPPAPQPEPGPEQPPIPEPEPGQPSVSTNLNITTISLSDARQDFNYSQTIQATGGRTPYNWSISGSSQLPSGLMINGSTGEIFGKPTVSGNFSFTIGIQDSSSPVKQATKQLSIKVAAPAASVVISNVASSNVTANSATIIWTTDKPSSSQVAYGPTTAYGTNTPANSSQATNHSVILSGLNGNTTYNYQVISSIADFTARSSNDDFKTLLDSNPFSIMISSLPDAVQGAPYSETIPLDGGQGPYTWSIIGTLPPGLKGNPVSGEISGTPTTEGTSTVTVKVEDSSTPKKTVTKPITIKVKPTTTTGGLCTGKACTFSGRPDIVSCSAVDPGDGCNLTVVNALGADIISGVAGRNICSGIDTVKLLKSIISNESRGRVDIISSDGLSQGPFQLTPGTATQYKRNCSIPESEKIDLNWLRNRSNVAKQACIAVEYIKSLVGSCGCDARQLAAGYNGGGGGACAVSADCGPSAGVGQCSICTGQNRPTRRWECLYDDTAHQSCNSERKAGTLAFTRRYAPKVEFCYNRF